MSYTIFVPESSIQKASQYAANLTSISGGVSLPDGTTITTSVGVPVIVSDPAYIQANTATSIAEAAFFYANTIGGGSAIDNVARVNAQSAYNGANTYFANTQNSITYISGVDSAQNTSINIVLGRAQAAFDRANTSSNNFIGTSGAASPSFGGITLSSTNGISVTGSGSTLVINTPQDVRTSASPTFNNLVLSNALSITQGGTGGTSAAAALTNLLPTGTTSGYVLTTGGPGTYYWAAGGGGGSGATPGTTISSTRLSYTANGSGLAYTTPTYIPGASQLRVYFDGLRQFASGYTETNSTTCTFGTAPAAGVVVLFEVDGYINNPYYANNITFTAPFGSIVSTANTIQLAIQDLETRKATLISPTLTGTPTAPTPVANTNNTQIATTAFVNSTIAANVTPVIAAAIAAALPTGVITMWSGSIVSIPSGWFLCNGSNGTPDLRDRFIVGAGSSYSVAGTGGSKDSVIVSHSHTASVTDPGHAHTFSRRGDDGQGTGAGIGVVGYNADIGAGGGDMVSSTTGISVGISTIGSSGTNANLPPYYALAYIMKA